MKNSKKQWQIVGFIGTETVNYTFTLSELLETKNDITDLLLDLKVNQCICVNTSTYENIYDVGIFKRVK